VKIEFYSNGISSVDRMAAFDHGDLMLRSALVEKNNLRASRALVFVSPVK
jgi:hypothetical protein